MSTVPPIRREVLVNAGTGQLPRAAMLATEDDTSVAKGFFSVTVRPWQVMMQAWPG